MNRKYDDILCRMALDQLQEHEHIEEKIERLSKRYGEIMLPEHDENKQLMYSDQFGLVILNRK